MSLSVIGYLPLWLPSQRGRRPDARSSRRGRPRTRLGEIALAAPSLAAVEQVAECEQGRPEGEEGAEQTPGVPDPAEDGEDDHDADPCRDRPGDQLQPESRAHPVVAPFVGRRRRAARPLISYPPASPARVSLSPPPQSMAAAPAAMRLLLGSRTGISARSPANDCQPQAVSSSRALLFGGAGAGGKLLDTWQLVRKLGARQRDAGGGGPCQGVVAAAVLCTSPGAR